MGGVLEMLFQDKEGIILLSEEINNLSIWEIQERGIHVWHEDYDF